MYSGPLESPEQNSDIKGEKQKLKSLKTIRSKVFFGVWGDEIPGKLHKKTNTMGEKQKAKPLKTARPKVFFGAWGAEIPKSGTKSR